MDVNSALARVVPNPLSLLENVLQHALQQLGLDTAGSGDRNPSFDELLAIGLGGRLARMIAGSQSATLSSEPTSDVARYQEPLNRNSEVAAALGACDCWGQNIFCSICDGHGRPGWATPDGELFDVYVGPALIAVDETDLLSAIDIFEE